MLKKLKTLKISKVLEIIKLTCVPTGKNMGYVKKKNVNMLTVNMS